MNILGTQVYSTVQNPLRRDSRAADSSVQDQARRDAEVPETIEQEGAGSVALVETAQEVPPEPQRDVTRISGLTATAKQFSLYPDEPSQGTTSTQLKALSVYRDTQNLSRIDSNIDYLGSIDISV